MRAKKLTSEQGIGVDVTSEAVLRSVAAKASSVDVEKRMSSSSIYSVFVLEQPSSLDIYALLVGRVTVAIDAASVVQIQYRRNSE